MCGVFGFAGNRRAVRAVDLDVALAALRHRGPDDRGTYLYEPPGSGDLGCALAHTRLSILDLSPAGRQPMTSEDGSLTLVFNGEVYNFAQLRAELESDDVRIASSGDTAVVLAAFQRWGRDAVNRLHGMFALGLWDRREGTLLLARDRLGIKPLYYREGPDGLAFSSEIGALLATGHAARVLSREGLRSYLELGSVAGPHTILDGVWSLPPAHILEYGSRGSKLRCYWTLPPQGSRRIGLRQAADELRPLLRDAVRSHLTSDVPLGVFLSGGIDSSVVAGIAAIEHASPVKTFTVVFDDALLSEETFAAQVAARFGCEHHQVRLSSATAAREVERAFEAMDQPSADGLNTYFVTEAARQAGLTVALSGLGGDELFAGYSNFRSFGKILSLGRFLAHVPGRLPESMAKGIARILGTNRARKLSAVVAARGDAEKTYAALRSMFSARQIEEMIGRMSGPLSGPPHAVDEADLAGRDAVNVFSVLELRNYMKNTLLRDTDQMSMAHAFEVRVPLLDDRIVEFVSALPGKLKVSGAQNKKLLVEAGPALPPESANRPKMGFVLPLDAWFRGPMRPFLSELFRSDSSRLGKAFRPDAISDVWSAFLQGEQFVSYSRICCLASLVTWCTRHRVELPQTAESGSRPLLRAAGRFGGAA